MKRRKRAWLLGLILAAVPVFASDQIGDIEFFGYRGLDVAKIRAALPVHEGDEFSDETKSQVRQAVAGVLGKEPTDVAAICCDDAGNRLLFIGLPGESGNSFSYNPQPNGGERLPQDIIDLYGRLDAAIEVAVRKGGDAAQEDDSNGYALIKDPDAQAMQLQVRDWALAHESELLRVLESSSDAAHRRVASDAVGYARQTRGQIFALVNAARDPDVEVRNNATRALGVLMRLNGQLAADIPPATFIEMLNSGTWTDRNKGASLLLELTAGRDQDLLAQIRATALDSLVEMASWRRAGHAFFARVVLGRIAGIPDDELSVLAWNGPVERILEAVRR